MTEMTEQDQRETLGLQCGTSCVNLTPWRSLFLTGRFVQLLLHAGQLAGHELGIEADHGLVGEQVYPAAQQYGGNLCCSAEDNVEEAAAFHSSPVAAAELLAPVSAACSRGGCCQCSAELW